MALKMINGLPVFSVGLNGADEGMERISLVDFPAVESNFLAFGKRQLFAIEDEEKRIIRGVVARADYPIFRTGDKGDYYIVFSPAVIRQMAEKYLTEGRANAVNLMHEQGYELTGVNMLQWYIKDSKAGINPAGFEAIADGSLFAEFHIHNDNIWELIKSGEFKGFSLEGVFSLQPEEDTTIKHTMSKLEKLREALRAMLVEIEMRRMTTDKGVIEWAGDDDLKVGDEVVYVYEDGNTGAINDGLYISDDGRNIDIKDGKVVEIREVEEEGGETEEKIDVEGADEDPLKAILDELDAIKNRLDALEKTSVELSAEEEYKGKKDKETRLSKIEKIFSK